MKYYLPNWEDRVDPGYNFLTEEHSAAHVADPKTDSYIWEIFPKEELPIDGVLVSRAALESVRSSEKVALDVGIHKFLRLPESAPVIADCGAWSYLKETKPTYDPIEILSYYDKLGVNYGVTVDHLVLAGYENQRQQRMEITYTNAVKAYEVWRKTYREKFDLLAAIQGWDADDYVRMLRNYLKRGMTHLAIGGLGKSPRSEALIVISRVTDEVRESSTKPTLLHLFGLGRISLFPSLARLENLGVEVSFDTASWLRRAWIGGNYYMVRDDRLTSYTSLRIPQIGTKRTGLKGRSVQETSLPNLKNLEHESLETIRGYSEGKEPMSKVVETVGEFDMALVRSGSFNYRLLTEIEPTYQRTLQDKPWQSCDCPICRHIGVEVALFRGNNRNRRRGFHNIFTMYHKVLNNKKTWRNGTRMDEERSYTSGQDLRTLNGKVLVLTSCSKLKSHAKVAKAKDLYRGRLFELTRKYCEVKDFPYFIISAKYALVRPNDSIETYDKVLRNEEDVKMIRPALERRLRPVLPHYDKVLVVAGAHYVSALKNLIDSRFVFVKSRGYGHLCSIIADAIGEQVPITQFLAGTT